MRVAVIGGGVVGVCTAYYLAEAGHEVAVVERYGNVAQEASFGNLDLMGPSSPRPWAMPGTPSKIISMLFRPESPVAFSARFEPAMWGWIRRWVAECKLPRLKLNHHRLRRLTDYSKELMEQLAHTHSLDYQQRSGVLMMFRTARDLQLAQPAIELMGAMGTRHELLDPEAARLLEPALSAETNFHSEVQAIRPEVGGISFQVNGRSIDVDAVVVAAGSDSAQLLKPIGVNLPLYPVKVYSASTPIQEFELAPQLSVYDDTYRVALTRLGKRIRIAGCAELGSSSVDLHQKAINTLVKVGDDWFPNAANYRTASFWCGPTGMLPEGVPLLGATRYPNVFINAGHGSGAWAMAAGSGKLLADMISGRRTDIDTDGLTLARYGDRAR
jgi:D-amino-acid dehydrogenase